MYGVYTYIRTATGTSNIIIIIHPTYHTHLYTSTYTHARCHILYVYSLQQFPKILEEQNKKETRKKRKKAKQNSKEFQSLPSPLPLPLPPPPPLTLFCGKFVAFDFPIYMYIAPGYILGIQTHIYIYYSVVGSSTWMIYSIYQRYTT